MAVHRIAVDSIPALVTSILELRRDMAKGAFLWFRGLSCSSYALLPKLMREDRPIEDVFEREMRLLTRFRQRSMAYWAAVYQQEDWDHLFAMQHYGLPTRLLDWSENVFVAAYFALHRADSQQHEHDGPCTPTISCLNPVAWNRSMPGLSEYGDSIHVLTTADDELEAYSPRTVRKRYKSPVAIYGSHNSDRIVAQRGTFMVWGNECKSLAEVAEDQNDAHLWSYELTGNRAEMFAHLQFLGFSETMVSRTWLPRRRTRKS